MTLPTRTVILVATLSLAACQEPPDVPEGVTEEIVPELPTPDYTLTADQTHARWSAQIEPVLTVEPGAVIEAYTEEATDRQLGPQSTVADLANVSFDPIHPLTGPVRVEGAEPGDLLKVTLHEIEVLDWGWSAIIDGFGFLDDEFEGARLWTFDIEPGAQAVAFNDRIRVPIRPFPGVMGVAPATDSMLSTIPPRANGGNMDNQYLTAGTTVYFPVFVEGANFSIGDTHAAQGDGEVAGTGVEAPMRIVYSVDVVKGAGNAMAEPQYETADYYGVSAYATTIDEAARKATQYMIDYLVAEHDLSAEEAYMLCSLAGDLRIAEVVDVPHVLVAMHMDKGVLGTLGAMRFE